MKKLGKNQTGCLQALRDHGFWYEGGFGCGWHYGGVSNTKRLLESLVRLGLVKVEVVEKPLPPPFAPSRLVREYRPV